jgi:hypothetical protein
MVMAEDLIIVSGVLLASAVCGWYVVHSISAIVLFIPADDVCGTVAKCLPLAMGG